MDKTYGVFGTVALLVGLAGATAHADSSKVSSGMGHDLAQTLCSRCHVVEPGKADAPGHVGAPAFQSVADRPGVSRETLRKHLRNTHSNAMIPLAMPNPQLSEDELIKIISYLLSLHQTAPAAGAKP